MNDDDDKTQPYPAGGEPPLLDEGVFADDPKPWRAAGGPAAPKPRSGEGGKPRPGSGGPPRPSGRRDDRPRGPKPPRSGGGGGGRR